MHQYQKLTLICFSFIIIFSFMPFISSACSFPGSYDLPAHSMLSWHYDWEVGGAYGSYTAEMSIVVFISDDAGKSYWSSYEMIPSSALWSKIGTNGSYDVNFPGVFIEYYVVFANNQSSTVHIDYELGTKIGGFLLGIIIFAGAFICLILFCVVSSKYASYKQKKSEKVIEYY